MRWGDDEWFDERLATIKPGDFERLDQLIRERLTIYAKSVEGSAAIFVHAVNRIDEEWQGKPRWAHVFPSRDAFLDAIGFDADTEAVLRRAAAARRAKLDQERGR